MIATKHLLIHGRVQGVFFRASLCREAAHRNITGWVRNRPDGSLEAMLQGESTAVEQLIGWARHGPPGASVERIDIADGEGDFDAFSALPTH